MNLSKYHFGKILKFFIRLEGECRYRDYEMFAKHQCVKLMENGKAGAA